MGDLWLLFSKIPNSAVSFSFLFWKESDRRMVIRVLGAVLFLFLVRVLNLTTEVNVRALSFILVTLKRFMSFKVNYFWLSFNVKLTELAVSIIKGLRMIRLLCWQVIASACFRMNEKFKYCTSRGYNNLLPRFHPTRPLERERELWNRSLNEGELQVNLK